MREDDVTLHEALHVWIQRPQPSAQSKRPGGGGCAPPPGRLGLGLGSCYLLGWKLQKPQPQKYHAAISNEMT